MVQLVNVSDVDSLAEWLSQAPHWRAVYVTHRMSLRVLPIAWGWIENSGSALSILPALRCLLNAQVALSGRSNAEFLTNVHAATLARGGFDIASEAGNLKSAFEADEASRSAFAVNRVIEAQSFSNIEFAVNAAVRAEATALKEAIGTDLLTPQDGEAAAQAPLWSEEASMPKDVWAELKRSLLDHASVQRDETARGVPPENWSFWVRWYDAALEGRMLDIDILEEVARLPSERWDKGPDVVNRLIQLIEEKHRIKAELASLEAKTAEAIGEIEALPPRGHNQPPELIEEADDALEDLRELQIAVREARVEVESRAPDASRLASAGKVIARVGIALAKYCGGKADIIVTEAAKKIGAGLGIAIVTITAVAATSGTLGPAIQEFAARWSAAQTQVVPQAQSPGAGTTPAP